jgi:DNA-binding MarR family transcriptional regulator
MLLILFLRRLDNEWIKMKDLIEQYNQSQPTVSKMIERLRKHDFVEEKKDVDSRFILLRLNKRALFFLDTTFNI